MDIIPLPPHTYVSQGSEVPIPVFWVQAVLRAESDDYWAIDGRGTGWRLGDDEYRLLTETEAAQARRKA